MSRAGAISGRTRVYGLLGDPVAHSLSPRIANHAFARLGVDAVYVALPCRTDDPAVLLGGLAALGLAGANVTYPFKSVLTPHLVSLSRTAAAVGAVNVLAATDDGCWRGENTDVPGVALALATWLDWSPAGSSVAILGGGAAARAAACGLLAGDPARVTLLVRRPEAIVADVARLRELVPTAAVEIATLGRDDADHALASADLVVQATPVGLDDPAARPLATPDQAPRAAGFELNYGPRPTAFATAWRDAGRRCLDGRDLLAAQARLTLEIWCGDAPPLAELRDLLDAPPEAAR